MLLPHMHLTPDIFQIVFLEGLHVRAQVSGLLLTFSRTFRAHVRIEQVGLSLTWDGCEVDEEDVEHVTWKDNTVDVDVL